MQPPRDLLNQRFGRLVAVEYLGLISYGNTGKRGSAWTCLCDCGGKKDVLAEMLVKGHTISCGCVKTENGRIRGLRKKYKYLSEEEKDRLFPYGDYIKKFIPVEQRYNTTSPVEDITGKKFNNLLVERFMGFEFRGTSERRKAKWECLCDCGERTQVFSTELVQGKTKSCGCLLKNIP